MAYAHELTITDRIRVSPSRVIGDDSTQENVIEAVVCIAKCTDDETNEVASTDPWVSIDLSELNAGDFVAQDLQQVLEGKNYADGIVKEDANQLNVAYQSIIPILTKAIQELTQRVKELENN